MRGRIRTISRTVALSSCVVLIVGLTFTAANAESVGCGFQAPATIGTADLVNIPSPPGPVPPEVAGAIGTAEVVAGLASAGCNDQFSCFTPCSLNLQYGFGGTGVIAGEVTITTFTAMGIVEVARATCGPTIGTPVSGGCFGALNAPLGAGQFFLDCRAHGVVAVLVSGFCGGQTF